MTPGVIISSISFGCLQANGKLISYKMLIQFSRLVEGMVKQKFPGKQSKTLAKTNDITRQILPIAKDASTLRST